MLLHGLCGHALEWRETAILLTDLGYRVLLPDQRGHGTSARRPADLSRAAYVADVEMWIESLEITVVALVGQSLGGHTAFLVASARPTLVGSLVVVEATPQHDASALRRLESWLARWPRPFASKEAAREFFGGDTPYARAWIDGLEERPDGLWPRFDNDIMLRSLRACEDRGYWSEWARVTCPTLLVRSDRGIDLEVASRMCELAPHTRIASIPNAGHDLHLESHKEWSNCLTFLAETHRL